MVLPGTRGSKYVVPSRAEDLFGLPPTFISVGVGDLFRDEDVAFASKLWKCGVNTELHVWLGACELPQISMFSKKLSLISKVLIADIPQPY